MTAEKINVAEYVIIIVTKDRKYFSRGVLVLVSALLFAKGVDNSFQK